MIFKNSSVLCVILIYQIIFSKAFTTRRSIDDLMWKRTAEETNLTTTQKSKPTTSNINSIIDDIWGQSDEKIESNITTNSEVNQMGSQNNITTITSCTCTLYYLCKDDSGDTFGGISINECNSYLEKCCKHDQIIKPPEAPTSRPDKSNKPCGYRNTNGVGFKNQNVKHNEAEYGEFSWTVAIFKLQNNTTYECGGTLINPQVVVTAAHCVQNTKHKYKIRAGEWDTQTEYEQYPHQERNVASITIHPKFNPKLLFNNIALLFLEQPIEIAPHINVVCLPPQNAIFTSKNCLATGWGQGDFEKKDQNQVFMKKVELPMVTRRRCEDDLRRTKLGRFFKLHDSFVCAGGEEGNDTCKGDGGSPLVCPIEGEMDRYFYVGIVSWGIGCGQNNIPGVYVNVALFSNWINQELLRRNLDISL